MHKCLILIDNESCIGLKKAGMDVWLQNMYPGKSPTMLKIAWDLVKGCGQKLVLIAKTQVWSNAACD